MSKNINVNPDHYKVAGRERQGEGIVRGPKPSTASELLAKGRWQARVKAKADADARAAAAPAKRKRGKTQVQKSKVK